MLIDSKTRVIVQGVTGHHGKFHTDLMLKYGTNIVAGVTPGKGGEKLISNNKEISVYNSISDAVNISPADYSVLFVPAPYVREAAFESLAAGLNLVIVTEHVPVLDVIDIFKEANERNLIVIGPNCPGIINPGESKIGIMPGEYFSSGNTGILSRSGTLTYEIVAHLTSSGIGQSTVVGIGGDMINGLNFVEGLKLFEEDDKTENILLIGEIGGDSEERAAQFIKDNVSKKVVAYLAGKTAPEGKTMGHAGAIISHGKGTFNSKVTAFKNAGVEVAVFPHDVPELLK